MTRVENFAPPPPNLSNPFSALADKPIEILGKNSDSSESNLVACEELTLSGNPSKRTSARSNKATTESLKDEQKVFSAINRPTAVPGTAASSAPSSVPTAVLPILLMLKSLWDLHVPLSLPKKRLVVNKIIDACTV